MNWLSYGEGIATGLGIGLTCAAAGVWYVRRRLTRWMNTPVDLHALMERVNQTSGSTPPHSGQ